MMYACICLCQELSPEINQEGGGRRRRRRRRRRRKRQKSGGGEAGNEYQKRNRYLLRRQGCQISEILPDCTDIV